MTRSFTCPPELWAEVERYIPARERSAALQEGLRLAVERYKRRAPEVDALAEEGYRLLGEQPGDWQE